MPLAVSYIRFSSGKQKLGHSEKRQEELLAKWLQAHPDYTLSSIKFSDLGRSGWSGAHLDHALGRLLAAIEHGEIPKGSVLLVEAVDRIGRLEPLEMLPILSKIVQEGIDIITLDDGTRYSRADISHSQLFLLIAKVQQAWKFSENLSNRIKAVWNNKREKARKGETFKKRFPLWINQEDGTLNETLAPHIRKAFEDCAAGLGNASILKRLRTSHPAFENISVSGVRHWFESEIALGIWEGIECHPAVVSKELYYRAIQTREGNKTFNKTSPSKCYLSGLVVCGECGKNYIYAGHGTEKKPQAPIMKCCNLQSLNCTNNKRAPLAVLDAIRRLTYAPFLKQALSQQSLNKNRKEIIQLEQEINTASKQIDKLITLALATDDISEITTQLAALKKQREDLRARKTLLEQSPSLPEVNKDHSIFDRAKGFLEMIGDSEKDLMRLNALLQHTDYRLIVSQGTNGASLDITVNGKVWQYQRWIKGLRAYVVIDPEGKQILVSSDRGHEKTKVKNISSEALKDRIKSVIQQTKEQTK